MTEVPSRLTADEELIDEGARSTDELTQAAAEGLRWIAYARVIIEVVLFASAVLLARMMPPAAFGIFAVIVIVQELAVTMPMEGVGGALVQRPTLTREHLQVMLQDASVNAPLLYHEEPILRDGVIVGSVKSGAWGHRLGRSIGMGYASCEAGVTREWLESGRWEVEVACRPYAASVQLQPWYDPKNERIKS